jgi:hypothetical protein
VPSWAEMLKEGGFDKVLRALDNYVDARAALLLPVPPPKNPIRTAISEETARGYQRAQLEPRAVELKLALDEYLLNSRRRVQNEDRT